MAEASGVKAARATVAINGESPSADKLDAVK